MFRYLLIALEHRQDAPQSSSPSLAFGSGLVVRPRHMTFLNEKRATLN